MIGIQYGWWVAPKPEFGQHLLLDRGIEPLLGEDQIDSALVSLHRGHGLFRRACFQHLILLRPQELHRPLARDPGLAHDQNRGFRRSLDQLQLWARRGFVDGSATPQKHLQYHAPRLHRHTAHEPVVVCHLQLHILERPPSPIRPGLNLLPVFDQVRPPIGLAVRARVGHPQPGILSGKGVKQHARSRRPRLHPG